MSRVKRRKDSFPCLLMSLVLLLLDSTYSTTVLQYDTTRRVHNNNNEMWRCEIYFHSFHFVIK